MEPVTSGVLFDRCFFSIVRYFYNKKSPLSRADWWRVTGGGWRVIIAVHPPLVTRPPSLVSKRLHRLQCRGLAGGLEAENNTGHSRDQGGAKERAQRNRVRHVQTEISHRRHADHGHEKP